MNVANIDESKLKKAEQCLIDNGIEPDEAETVLQALGYILLDKELYPTSKEDKSCKKVNAKFVSVVKFASMASK